MNSAHDFSSMAKAPVVFGLDIGIGSLGECVRVGNDFIHVESLLIDQDFAGTQAQAVKRRMFRTRQAHKARELWLNRQCEAVGIPVLKQIAKTGSEFFRVKNVDKRLNQEFPAKGDETIYTSCLLRIALLEGKQLEPWQIYKALHSAIQKRGYDQDVAWKTRSEADSDDSGESSAKAKKEEEEENEKLSAFLEQLQKMSSDQRHHLPCYFEAYQMGVWSPNEGVVKIRQDNHAKPASLNGKGYTASREMVLKELRGLLVAAKKHFPKLGISH
jgi:CRISPR-associated endonuclease Csn1